MPKRTSSILTVKQAAEKLGVSPGRVHQLIQAKRLRATRMGWEYLIRAHDLDAVRIRPPGRPRKTKQEVCENCGIPFSKKNHKMEGAIIDGHRGPVEDPCCHCFCEWCDKKN